MKKLIVLVIFCSLLFTVKGFSQQGKYMSVQYAVGFGTGDMGEFISATSFRGALIEYRAGITDNLSIGVDLGWNVFYEKQGSDTYTSGTESVSGAQYRYHNTVPILVSADYLLLTASQIKPYVGFGIGTMYNEKSVDMNIYRFQDNVWQFAIKPEIGFLYELSYSTSFKLAVKYYNGFKTTDMENQGYFSLNAGFTFMLD